MWPMPLWPGYEEDLSSRVADLNNVSATPFAGSIVGALFLKRFVTRTRNWLHGDCEFDYGVACRVALAFTTRHGRRLMRNS